MGRERFLFGHSPCLCFASHSRNPRNSRLKHFVKKTRNDIFVIQEAQAFGSCLLCLFVADHCSSGSGLVVPASSPGTELALRDGRRGARWNAAACFSGRRSRLAASSFIERCVALIF